MPLWWRLAGLWQGLLLGAAVIGLTWMVAILIFGVFGAAPGLPHLLTSASQLPWLFLGTLATLGLGAATSSVCMSWVSKTAERERAEITVELRRQIEAVAGEMVIVLAEQELSELRRFREELRTAARTAGPAPAS